MKKVVATELAPAAIGPYSQGIMTEKYVFTSGQIPVDPKVGKITAETIEGQTEQVMKNLKAVLAESELGMDRIVKTTCFLSDIADFSAFNAVYAKYFPENPPARSCVQAAALPMGAKVEVECIAVR